MISNDLISKTQLVKLIQLSTHTLSFGYKLTLGMVLFLLFLWSGSIKVKQIQNKRCSCMLMEKYQWTLEVTFNLMQFMYVWCSLEVVKYLYEHSADKDIHTKDEDGRTPWHIACKKDSIEIVKYWT